MDKDIIILVLGQIGIIAGIIILAVRKIRLKNTLAKAKEKITFLSLDESMWFFFITLPCTVSLFCFLIFMKKSMPQLFSPLEYYISIANCISFLFVFPFLTYTVAITDTGVKTNQFTDKEKFQYKIDKNTLSLFFDKNDKNKVLKINVKRRKQEVERLMQQYYEPYVDEYYD